MVMKKNEKLSKFNKLNLVILFHQNRALFVIWSVICFEHAYPNIRKLARFLDC